MKADASIVYLKLLVILAGCCLTSGCGGDEATVYPVSGEVTFPDGSKLKYGGSIVFIRTNSEERNRASASFGPDGRFELSTYERGDGAVEGEYNVAVVPKVPEEGEARLTEEEYLDLEVQIDQRFQNPSASGLKFTVAAETSPHEFRVEVTKPQKRSRRRRR